MIEDDELSRSWSLKGIWRDGVLTLEQFASHLIHWIKDLRELDSNFKHLCVDRPFSAGSPRYIPVPEDLDSFASAFMDLSWDRGERCIFVPMNPEDESPLPQSTSVGGYRLSRVNWLPEVGAPGDIRLSVRAGTVNRSNSNYCIIVFQESLPFTSTEFQRRLLGIMLRSWPIQSAVLSSGTFWQGLSEAASLRRDRRFPGPLEIGWLTFVRKPGLAEALPPGTRMDSFGDPPGTLITLDGGGFNPRSPEQFAQALRIRKALEGAGQLGDPGQTPRDQVIRDGRPYRSRGHRFNER